MNFLLDINPLFYDFLVITLLSLVIGLEQRRHHMEEEEGSDLLFGTDRTFTFIGIFGFILFQIDPVNKIFFLSGGGVIAIFLAVFYHEKISHRQKYGLTSIVAALITYCLAPLVITQPKWFALLIVVTVLILTEIKSTLFSISKKFDKDEFITLAKFIVIAFIILPNLPRQPFSPQMPISLYDMWLALVVVSGISYFSYLLRKFIFTSSGVIISGILGGLYSSTAVTLLLSKQSNDKLASPQESASGIIVATSVMYIRVFLLLLIFNSTIAAAAFKYILLFFLVSLITAFVIYRSGKLHVNRTGNNYYDQKNPLEFKMALLFMLFYVLFSFLSQFAEKYYGAGGIHLLSFMAGFADVDAFIMNILQGKYAISTMFVVIAVLLATTSNNIIKLTYALVFAESKTRKILLLGFGVVILINIIGIYFAQLYG